VTVENAPSLGFIAFLLFAHVTLYMVGVVFLAYFLILLEAKSAKEDAEKGAESKEGKKGDE
jgi:hypothetical protein